MIAIFKREFKNFFQNVIGWVFLSSMIFVASLYFRAYNIGYGLSDIIYVLVRLLILFVFAIPVLSMRILTEDRRQKIDQLTLTAPISVGKIIVGKYLAMFAVLLISTISIGAFPILLSSYARIDWGVNLIAMLGFLLYGAACIAICLFISSFTESQVIAAIISIVSMFVIYLMNGIVTLFENAGNTVFSLVAKVFSVFDLTSKFDVFLAGIIDYREIVYFISVVVVFLFLTTQSVQKRRYTTSVANFSFGAFSVVNIVVVLTIAFFLNWGMYRIPDKYAQFDFTSNRLYSICDATKNVVETINEPITIYVYAPENEKDEVVDKILKKYTDLSSSITVEYIDPNKSPKFYENYTSSLISNNSLIFEGVGRTKVVDYNDLYIDDYVTNEDGSYDTVTYYDIEGQITSALNFLKNGVSAKIYNLTGHDEMTLDSTYLDTVKKQNYTIEDISLVGEELPEDCELLIINSPQQDIAKEDADKIIEYAKNGGQLLIVTPYVDMVDMTNFNSIMSYYGVTSDIGLVIDEVRYADSPYILIPNVIQDDVTNGIAGIKPLIAPYAKALHYDAEDTSCSYSEWLVSSDSSYKINAYIETISDITFTVGQDEYGQFTLGLTATKSNENGSSSAYFVGSSVLFTELADQRTANASLTVFTNIINKSVDAEIASVVVPVKSMTSERFIISNIAGIVIFLVLFLVVPVLLLIAGFVVWAKRRKK